MNNILIELNVDKEPYIKKLTDDKVINLTGDSGAGKSYYTRKYKNNDNYIVVDTDEIFSRYENASGINREIGMYLRNKYSTLPSLFEDFETIYLDILDYLEKSNKIIVIDSAQFRNIKNDNQLKGTIIVMRTSIDICYQRCISRYKENHKTATEEEIEKYSERKKAIYKWYESLNDLILKIDKL